MKQPISTNTTSPTNLSWSRKVQPERISLVHQHRKDDQRQSPSTTNVTTYFSRIWIIGRSPGSVMFDVSPCSGNLLEILGKTMAIMPTNNGALIHRDGKRIYLEVNLKTQEERNLVMTKGVQFTSDTIVIATAALDKGSQIKKLRLSNLPSLDADELEDGLRQTFSNYGAILDLGIIREARTKAYVGNGYAILDIQQQNGKTLTELGHHIPWCGDEDELIYAYFDQMPMYCSRCHALDHVRRDCPRKRYNKKNGDLS